MATSETNVDVESLRDRVGGCSVSSPYSMRRGSAQVGLPPYLAFTQKGRNA
jgi:hypothetical protein